MLLATHVVEDGDCHVALVYAVEHNCAYYYLAGVSFPV